MIVELISVGTEILLGNIVNTNANYLAQQCAALGISNYYQVSVGDNEERLSYVLETALFRSDIVILTGGLGPTKDDLTKEVTAATLKKNLIEDSTVVDNQNGTAPGLIVKTNEGKIVILLPGPPNELIPMFEQDIYPYLDKLKPGILYSEMVKICGIGESRAETMIYDLIEQQTNPTIAPYAKSGEVHLRVTASATNLDQGKSLVKPIVDELKRRFTTNIFTTNEKDNLEDVVVHLLSKHHVILSTAESCTGGLLSGRIVNVPGASSIFGEGFITYSNEAKQKYLNVEHKTLENFGAVSKETATEMALGVIATSGSNASIAITGLAGPDGGTEEKPVGLVYIACVLNGKLTVKEYHFNGNRQKIREYVVINALNLLRNVLIDEYKDE